MEFIREDGKVYTVDHKDSQKRLSKADEFKKVEDLTVEQLKNYCKKRGITGYSSMVKIDLIKALKEGG